MRHNVIFMDLAVNDYDDISDYLSRFYPRTIEKFLNELEKYIAVLKENPYAFEKYKPKPQYRRMVVMEYLVFYKVIDKTHTVEIHRILHGARNIKQFLR